MTVQETTPETAIPVARSAWMPPRFFLLYGLAGVALHFALGGPRLVRLPWLGAAVFTAGLGGMLWAVRCFADAGTTIKPFERTHVLVASGPYRWSRNPMYLGMVGMLVGAALALGTPGPWLAAAALAATLQLGFIRHEERALAASLGEPYARYRAEVRRWL